MHNTEEPFAQISKIEAWFTSANSKHPQKFPGKKWKEERKKNMPASAHQGEQAKLFKVSALYLNQYAYVDEMAVWY